jgi:hypothetical protein
LLNLVKIIKNKNIIATAHTEFGITPVAVEIFFGAYPLLA